MHGTCSVKVRNCLLRSLVLHHIAQEVPDDLAVLLGLIQILKAVIAINLCVAGGIEISFRSKIVLMLVNQASFTKAKNIESYLRLIAGCNGGN